MPYTNKNSSDPAVAAGLEQAYAYIASHPASSSNMHKSTRSNSISYPKSPKGGGGQYDPPPSSARRADAAITTLNIASTNAGAVPTSPGTCHSGLYGGTPRKASAAGINATSTASLSAGGYSAHNLARHPSNPYNSSSSGAAAPHPARTSSNSSSYSNALHSPAANSKPSVEVKHGKVPGQIWMPEGIVDMTSFGPILAMDDNDPSREFSKALVWAWCDQAEAAIEEMEQYLFSGEIARLADKAHYLKGSSASLGLVQVSATCHSIYHIHYPPSLAHLRTFSYTGGGNSGLSSASSRHSSSASSASSGHTASAGYPYTPYTSDGSSPSSSLYSPPLEGEKPMMSPHHSPGGLNNGGEFPFHASGSAGTMRMSPGTVSGTNFGLAAAAAGNDTIAHFEKQKLARAQALLEDLKVNVKTGSEWLYAYYRESDKYAGL